MTDDRDNRDTQIKREWYQPMRVLPKDQFPYQNNGTSPRFAQVTIHIPKLILSFLEVKHNSIYPSIFRQEVTSAYSNRFGTPSMYIKLFHFFSLFPLACLYFVVVRHSVGGTANVLCACMVVHQTSVGKLPCEYSFLIFLCFGMTFCSLT